MCLHLVYEQCSSNSIALVAAEHWALVILLALVDRPNVSLQVTLIGEPTLASVAREGPFAGVGLLVLRLFVRRE